MGMLPVCLLVFLVTSSLGKPAEIGKTRTGRAVADPDVSTSDPRDPRFFSHLFVSSEFTKPTCTKLLRKRLHGQIFV
jgi:hypothetical protein